MKNGKGIVTLFLISLCVMTGCGNHIKEGTELLESGNAKEAKAVFEQVVEEAEKKGEDASEGYRGLGMACYAQEDYESARTNLQKALDAGGVETPAVYNLIGACSMRLEDYDTALAAFERGMTLPESMLISEGSREEQTADYQTAIQEMMLNRVVCYEKKLDWENAKAAISEYVLLYPEDEEAQREAEFLETR